MYASSWPFDPVVVAEKERLLAETASKTQIIRELHNIARGGHKDSLAAYRLMAEIQQWVGHGSVSTVKDAKNGRASDGQMAELAALVVNSPQVKDSGV